jgi:hypothetical protein
MQVCDGFEEVDNRPAPFALKNTLVICLLAERFKTKLLNPDCGFKFNGRESLPRSTKRQLPEIRCNSMRYI